MADRHFGAWGDQSLTEEELRAREKVRVTNTFIKHLEILSKGKSRVIVVQVFSEDPKTAAKIANTHADLYIIEQLEVKFVATRRATAWLNERVATLRDKVKATERVVEAFREKSGLLGGEDHADGAVRRAE